MIDSIEGLVIADFPRQIDLWGGISVYGRAPSYPTMDAWQTKMKVVRTFAEKRPEYLWKMLRNSFRLANRVLVELNAGTGGTLEVERVFVGNWYSGYHFENVPLVVKAVPLQGYEFVGWKGDTRKEASIQIVPSQNITLAPIFRKIF
jgi:hypothetical protein